jgi:UDP-GlcNAc:undecaprenyl-phosphate/decaprenyl-phosphate GlcNAc-1-phosphate transferase
MSPELKALSAFAIAAVATYLVTPIAISIAIRTSFFDVPADYKGHKRPTPYLGGTAIMIGIVVAVASVRGGVATHGLIIGVALLIWLMGTVDDRINLPISGRMLVEVGIAVLLWDTGRGWTVFHNDPADLVLTVVWVVGVMNAFNLMDNMDGAAATTAAISAAGAGVLALLSGDVALAPLSFAVAGACFGFLPRNLARPARIFMGDGGSLLVGLLVARVTMAAVTRSYLGPSGVIVAALLVGLVILDTTLVTVSRTRGGRPVLTGGRDHLTHRLSRSLGSPRRVALTLAVTQVGLCTLTIIVARAGGGWVLLAGALGLVFAAVLIWQLEMSPWLGRSDVQPDHPAIHAASSPLVSGAPELPPPTAVLDVIPPELRSAVGSAEASR